VVEFSFADLTAINLAFNLNKGDCKLFLYDATLFADPNYNPEKSSLLCKCAYMSPTEGVTNFNYKITGLKGEYPTNSELVIFHYGVSSTSTPNN
jgi:hypothetical protein